MRRFVVQRHRASRLHYDFRLELHGVLVSWAVPKGPTLDPNARRAAIAVEDHELDYIDFEGVIPEGQYGAGDVTVWDTGTWEPAETDDPERALADGALHFDLHGEKLNGRFVITRTSRSWLLLHKKDRYAVAGWNPEEHPASVLSGRTNDEVSADDQVSAGDQVDADNDEASAGDTADTGTKAHSTKRTRATAKVTRGG